MSPSNKNKSKKTEAVTGREEEEREEEEEEEAREEARPVSSTVDRGMIAIYPEITPKKAIKFIRDHIKSYSDYKTVPRRRETDLTFRENIAYHINKTNDTLKEIHALLIEKQMMSSWAIAERLIGEIDFFVREVEKGDFGFTTFFDNPKLLEMDITQLYLTDYELIVALKAMRERVEAFMEMVKSNYLEDVDLWFETIDRIMGAIIKLTDDRTKLIGSYERVSY